MIQDQDFKYKPKREAMVRWLSGRGIANQRVLGAMLAVKRHLFMDTLAWDLAYDDNAFPIGGNQTISQPFTVAYMTSLVAEHYPSGRVLEIGTGSGYQAAVLCQLGYQVFTIERIAMLYEKSKKVFSELGLRVMQRHGDGTLGWNEMSPFAAIVVTAGSPDVPNSLLGQLKDGGRLIIPVGDTQSQQMKIYHREGETVYETAAANFSFVPLIGKEGWQG
ncbi:MAG: protein-L-isoaspartate(D-aspartate) O-methyltransferase [Rhizobacter sp.]|nr:protein-L-isoaspartate(D-aspartate) O-methyltransferase [Chlorobiales bacterium]